MKKIISLISGFAIASCAFCSGCVDDNQYVILRGVSSDCEPNNIDQQYWLGCGLSNNAVQAHVMSAITGETPWSSSGGSSGGSTFENKIPNQGTIYVDKVVIECVDIDGDEDACKGKDSIERIVNMPIIGAAGACIGMGRTIDEAGEWGDNVRISLRAHYHDPSYIKGTTNKSYLLLSSKSDPCVPKDVQDALAKQDNNPDDDEDNKSENDKDNTSKKKSGELCSSNDECESGECVSELSPDGMTIEQKCM